MILGLSEWSNYKERLEALFHDSFGKSIDPAYFDWRYINNHKEQLLFSLEVDAQTVAASYSAFPVDLECDGEVVRTALSMTTMTHPEWRGKGLFPKLATELYSQSKGEIAAVWGFPNANSHSTFINKLEWLDIYEIPTMALDLAKVQGGHFQDDSLVKRDDDFLEEYSHQHNDGLIRVHKSREYLRWRYAENPVNSYENHVISERGIVSSYVVTKAFGRSIDVVDMCFSNASEAKALLGHLIKKSVSDEMVSINCWMPTHHWSHAILERLGFTNVAPITYFAGRKLNPEKLPEQWASYRGWYLQMGDSDVY